MLTFGQGPAPVSQQPQIPAPNPQESGRVPLLFGGQLIMPNHPFYSIIQRAIMDQNKRPPSGDNSPTPTNLLRRSRSRVHKA